MRGRVLGAGGRVLSALVLASAPCVAQIPTTTDSAVAVPSNPQPPAPSTAGATPGTSDSTRRPTTPMGAMFRSFLLPGWGQAVYGRKTTAGIMIGFEGLSLGMLLKVHSEMEQIPVSDTTRINNKRQERQDWMALLVFNHLMSGLEAYVSSHLYDFPGDLQFRALPGGGVGASVTLPLGRR